MSKGKKYGSHIEQTGDCWAARITRQVTSKKVTVTREQAGFTTEAEAQEWADKVLAEMTVMQASRNERRGKQRRDQEEGRRERSVQRAEKTKERKSEKSVIEADLEVGSEQEQDDWSEELSAIRDSEV